MKQPKRLTRAEKIKLVAAAKRGENHHRPPSLQSIASGAVQFACIP